MKIFIDPGHNFSGGDTGASGYGLREELVSFAIADKLRGMLTGLGHDVKMSRNSERENVGTGSESSSINGRVKKANDWGADIFISIHCDAYDKTAHGTGTLVYSKNSEAAKIAKRVQSAIINQIGTVNRGVKERKDLGVLRLTNCPAILVETAFIDNEADAWLLKTRAEDFAAAICEGLTGQRAQEKEEKNMEKFNDIQGHYAEKFITELQEMGIVNGKGNGTFAPNEPITRADVSIMVRNAIRYITGK